MRLCRIEAGGGGGGKGGGKRSRHKYRERDDHLIDGVPLSALRVVLSVFAPGHGRKKGERSCSRDPQKSQPAKEAQTREKGRGYLSASAPPHFPCD